MSSWRDLTVKTKEEANVYVASISFDNNVSVEHGARHAPKKLRKLSSFLPPASKDGDLLTSLKLFDFKDIGDNFTDFDIIEQRAKEIYELDKFTVMIGGDHSVSIPLQKAFYDDCIKKSKIPAIIHIDAHPDICDVYNESKYSHACPNFRAKEYGYKTEDIVLVAVRGFETQEIELFKNHPEIEIIKATEIVNKGLKAIKHLKYKFDERYSIYLSFDIDAIDPSFAPGTGTPEAFGISTFQANDILTFLVENLPIKAMDIMEISPRLDINDITSWTALKLLYEVFSSIIKKENLGGTK